MQTRPIILLFIVGTAFSAACGLILGLAGPVQAQEFQPDGITAPENEEVVAGVVLVQGTVNHPDFLRYELSFYKEFDPYAGWIVFAEGDQQVISGTLAVWDTTVGKAAGTQVFPDGLYRLRLRVVRQDYNYEEYFVINLLVSNDSPTPTPTITPTETPDPSASATPSFITTESAPEGGPGEAIQVLPSLTPFPTPSRPPAPENRVGEEIQQPAGSDPVRDIVTEVQNIESGRFFTAAWQGIRLTLWLFGGLGVYLVLRFILRKLWLHFISSRKQK